MKRHDSMRGYFAYYLLEAMRENENIMLLLGGLGWGIFDEHKKEFPDRVINCGISEFAMMGMAVGLALEGKVPFVYSITTFLLYRPFEIIRTYINYEDIPVKLIGSGRDYDYQHDGWSHQMPDDKEIMKTQENIFMYHPQKQDDITLPLIKKIVEYPHPVYINLKR